MFKKWFSSSTKSVDQTLTVDELIVIEEYEEARDLLNERLRYHPKDVHAHLKLAEVYQALKDPDSCKQEYMHVAGFYAADGFYDKARAILTKVSRIFPGEIDIEQKMSALQRAKRLDHTRGKARAGLLATQEASNPLSGRMAVEFETVWNELSKTVFVDQISSEDLYRLFSAVEIVEYGPGRVLAAAGSEEEILFLVAKGSVEARVPDDRGHQVTLRAFGPGDILGDGALFSHRPWPANFQCVTAAKVLVLRRAGLKGLIAGHSDPKAVTK
jgi:tetratricopeptide (TPR) repeat protein